MSKTRISYTTRETQARELALAMAIDAARAGRRARARAGRAGFIRAIELRYAPAGVWGTHDPDGAYYVSAIR